MCLNAMLTDWQTTQDATKEFIQRADHGTQTPSFFPVSLFHSFFLSLKYSHALARTHTQAHNYTYTHRYKIINTHSHKCTLNHKHSQKRHQQIARERERVKVLTLFYNSMILHDPDNFLHDDVDVIFEGVLCTFYVSANICN